MIFSPLNQFSIIESFILIFQLNFFGATILLDCSITLFSLESISNLFFLLILILLIFFLKKRNFFFINFFFLLIFSFVHNTVKQQLKNNNLVNKYFVLVYTIFIYILVQNLFGLIPYSFVITAQLGHNIFLSTGIIIFFTFIGIFFLKRNFLKIFLPSAPTFLVPALFIIELISYIARIFSLAIRLFANLMSGHTLLFILCSFSMDMSSFGLLITLIIILLVFFLEIIIAFMQAYVFMILITVYLKDSLVESHH